MKDGQHNVQDTLTLTDANTQYSFTFPAGTTAFTFQCRDGTAIRYSTTTGLVATPTGDYLSLLASGIKKTEGIYLKNALTYYFACGSAAKVVEIDYWTW